MNLTDAKALLKEHNIPFDSVEYESEEKYIHHISEFQHFTENKKSHPVTALVIYSNNRYKNIELQFIKTENEFTFNDLIFGGYCYEMFDYNPEFLKDDLIEYIYKIMSGNIRVIEVNNLKKKRWNADALFDISDHNDNSDYQKTINRIKTPKNFFCKLFRTSTIYEIYDWNTYESIVK